MKALKTAALAMAIAFGANSAHALEVVTPNLEGDDFTFSVLQLALSKSAPDATFKELTKDRLNEKQLMSRVQSGDLSVMWSGASKDKDESMQAVRIPVMKGLLGHRIFLIKDGDQGKFESVKTVDDLKALKAGSGTFWGDTAILESAGLPVIKTVEYANLFPMLNGARFDYFPRAVNEPWGEVNAHPGMNFAVEKNVMLVYPSALHFYVKKDNKELHDLIYEGFETAIKDGSFDELFFNNPYIKDVIEKTDFKNRTVIRIDNPNMHPDTPIDRKEFWLDVENL